MEQLTTAQNLNKQQETVVKPVLSSPKNNKEKGFSFLDFLVIISALFVIGFLGYLYFNPNKEGAETRNIHRSADISSMLTSLYNYIEENNSEIPEVIPTSQECVKAGHEICKAGPYDCTGFVNLSFLSNNEELLLSLPIDPENKSINGTGYYIVQDGLGSITVCAPYAERNVKISFTKYMY